MEEEAKVNLEQVAIINAKGIDEGLKATENYVEIINTLIKQTIDLNSISDEYMSDFLNYFDSFVSDVMNSDEDLLGCAIILNPELTNEAHQLIYERNADTKNVNKVYKFDKSRFVEGKEDMTWYYNAVKAKDGIWSDPHTDGSSTSTRIAFTKPIYIGETLIGVIAVDLFFDDYKNMINDITVYDNGYAFLLNENGNYLVDKELTKENNYKEKFGNMDLLSSESGIKDGKVDGKEIVLAHSKLYNGNVLVAIAENNDIYKNLRRGVIIIIVITLVICAIVTGLALVIGRKISDPIVFITGIVNKISNLDFRKDESFERIEKFVDEIGIIGNSVINLRESVVGVLGELKECSEETTDNSKNLGVVAEDLSRSISSINIAVSELAKGAEQQAEEAQSSSEKLMDLSEKVDDINHISGNFKDEFEKLKSENDKGIKAINVLMEKIEETNKIGEETNKNVSRLADKSELIGDIVKAIDSISEETNLLALNAAIEAARAGEAGKGFSVVAEGIIAICEESAASTQEVSATVQEQLSTVENMRDSTKDLNVIVNKLEEISNKFIIE